ncbi:MAG: hypothetical protein E7381_02560 [Clostridiales bacterium]|nr:hypothetical protein [Clostridiales bacterium]
MRFALWNNYHKPTKSAKTLTRWFAQPAVAFGKAFFRLTTAIAIEAQRLCLCTPRGNHFLDLLTWASVRRQVGKNAYALIAQPAVAFGKALFRLTTAIAIEVQRRCLCNLQGNYSLAPFPFAVKRGEGLQICAEHGRFADATLLSVNERGEYR